MCTRLPVAAQGASWSLAFILIAASGIIAAPPSLAAQVTVRYPPGIYGQYRRDLADYAVRALTLEEDIGKVDINSTYCTSAERAAVNAELEALSARMAQLKTDYTAFKAGVERGAETSSIMAAFNAAGDNPKADNFWTLADREILTHPQADLNAKFAELKNSKLIDCRPKAKLPVKKVDPPAEKTKTAAPNPLAGLTRPTVPAEPPMPPKPAPFCSDAERFAWIKKNLQPAMDANIDASFALNAYDSDLRQRMASKAVAGDPAQVSVLQAEIEWGIKAHHELDRWYFQMARFRDSTSVVDCTTKTTTGPKPLPLPFPQESLTVPFPKTKEKEKGKDKVGMVDPWRWRVGVGGEYSHFPEFAHTTGDQKSILTSTGKQNASGIGVSFGIGYHDWELDLSGHSNTLQYEQTYRSNLLLPTRTMGDLHGRFFDLCGGRRFRYRQVELHGLVGLTYAIDELFLDQSFDDAPFIRSSRTLNTWKTNFGVNVSVPIYRGLEARVGSTYTTGGKSTDADLNYRFHAGLSYGGSLFPNR